MFARLTLAVTAAAALTGCFGAKKSPEAAASTADRTRPIVERTLEEEGLIQQEIDLDASGTPDIFNYFKKRADGPRMLVRKELDLNLDGKIDLISHFDPTGQLTSEEMDSDFDGKMDWVDHYEAGQRVHSEVDTDFDGIADVFSYFRRQEDGSVLLDRKERDTDGNGLIDYWERFDANGEVVKIGRDTDGDGKMDERTE